MSLIPSLPFLWVPSLSWVSLISIYALLPHVVLVVKNLPANAGVWSLGWEDPLEVGTATHSSILAWKIPMDRGAWRVIIHRVANSWTWLKRFSTAYQRTFDCRVMWLFWLFGVPFHSMCMLGSACVFLPKGLFKFILNLHFRLKMHYTVLPSYVFPLLWEYLYMYLWYFSAIMIISSVSVLSSSYINGKVFY